MIPRSLSDDEELIADGIEIYRTYKILEDKLTGYTNDVEALKQAIYKVLNTERYEYPIYSFFYGIHLQDLLGKDGVYVQSELKRRIVECLENDERIESIENFKINVGADVLTCVFDVISIYGNMTISKEVNN